VLYATAFFLIKLWIPILWFVYISMVDASAILMSSAVIINHGIHFIGNGIEYAITTFTGQPVFAYTLTGSQYYEKLTTAMAVLQAANRFTSTDNLVLTSMYVIIPTVLGSPATYLISKGTIETAVSSYYAGIQFFKDFGKFTVRAGPVFAAAGAAIGGAIVDVITAIIGFFF